MSGTEIDNWHKELRHAKLLQNFYFILMMIFAFAFIVGIILLSSHNSENITKITNLIAENSKLTIERDVLLKVRCAETSVEFEEETTIEEANNSVEIVF